MQGAQETWQPQNNPVKKWANMKRKTSKNIKYRWPVEAWKNAKDHYALRKCK